MTNFQLSKATVVRVARCEQFGLNAYKNDVKFDTNVIIVSEKIAMLVFALWPSG